MSESEFQKNFSGAPQKVQDFFFSEELTEATKNMVVLAKLTPDQTIALTDMIGQVLLGQKTIADFAREIGQRLNLPTAPANIITELAKEKIFGKFAMELEQYRQNPTLAEASLTPETPPVWPLARPPAESLAKAEINAEPKLENETPMEPINTSYSFPEPSEIKVEKPVNKSEGLKKIIAPAVSVDGQEKIREKLLAAMQKRSSPPKILERMKKISLRPKNVKSAASPTEKPLTQSKKEITPSQILGGQGTEFRDEETFTKSKQSKPYILDVKLKESPSRHADANRQPTSQPIPYKKYQKENPFGNA